MTRFEIRSSNLTPNIEISKRQYMMHIWHDWHSVHHIGPLSNEKIRQKLFLGHLPCIYIQIFLFLGRLPCIYILIFNFVTVLLKWLFNILPKRQFFWDYQGLKNTRKLRDWELLAQATQQNCYKIGLIFCHRLKMGTYSSKNKIFGLQKAIQTYENTSLAPSDI